jgi:hypothetical protein
MSRLTTRTLTPEAKAVVDGLNLEDLCGNSQVKRNLI